MAQNARRAAQRRARREVRTATPEAVQPVDQLTGRELLAMLDEELDKLPLRYREPLVLCYLEGLTRDEAAARLGVPSVTLKSQLERGRKRLAVALTGRGCALGTGLLALAATSPAGASPARLVQSVLTAASGSPSAAVVALVNGVAVQGLMTKTLLLFAGAAALAAGLASASLHVASGSPDHVVLPQTSPPPAARDEARARQAADNKDSLHYTGRVLDPDNRPVWGAKLYVSTAGGYFTEPYTSPEYATSGLDGRFDFTIPRAKFGAQPTVVAAAAANYGAGWSAVLRDGKRDNLTLRLVRDDVPIVGQIVDLEGKPVHGATVRVLQINAAVGEDLSPWLEAAKDKKAPATNRIYVLDRQHVPRYTIALSPMATTDAEGRFRLTGIGRDRLVRAHLDGPTIASQQLQILTRPIETISVTDHEGDPEYGDPRTATTYYGSNFRHVAAPTKPIVGVVRDKDTKQPVPNVTIRSYLRRVTRSSSRGVHPVRTTTDQEGRYRLVGMPVGSGYSIAAFPASGQPYVAIRTDVPDRPGLEPVTVDIELKRGVWIEGKITDKVTGTPLRGAVVYFSMYTNPNLRDYPGFGVVDLGSGVGAKDDGSFRIAGVPGPGILAVVYHHEPYLRADGRDDEFGTREKTLNTSPYAITFPSNYNALARIDPPKGVDAFKRDITLDPGWACTVHVLGPDGKPLAGVHSFGLSDGWRWTQSEAMKSGKFAVGFNQNGRSDFALQHPEKGLIGVAQFPKENGSSVTVQMQRGAAITGRLVDAQKQPLSGVDLDVTFRKKEWRFWVDFSPARIKTDGEGQFRIGALLPGYEYRLSNETHELRFGDSLGLGQTKDLGEVQLKPQESLER